MQDGRGTALCNAGTGLPVRRDSFVGALETISNVIKEWVEDNVDRIEPSPPPPDTDPSPIAFPSLLRRSSKECSPNHDIPTTLDSGVSVPATDPADAAAAEPVYVGVDTDVVDGDRIWRLADRVPGDSALPMLPLSLSQLF